MPQETSESYRTPRRWGRKIPIAILTALCALAGGLQAIAPAPAAAEITQTEDGVCELGYSFDWTTMSCTLEGAGGETIEVQGEAPPLVFCGDVTDVHVTTAGDCRTSITVTGSSSGALLGSGGWRTAPPKKQAPKKQAPKKQPTKEEKQREARIGRCVDIQTRVLTIERGKDGRRQTALTKKEQAEVNGLEKDWKKKDKSDNKDCGEFLVEDLRPRGMPPR
jgi:hypothetical protein